MADVKMNIIFDIDDTITDETGFLLKYAPGYLKKHYGIETQVKNPDGYNVSEVFGLYEIFRRDSSLSEKDIEEKCRKAVNGFWNSHFLRYMFYPIREDAAKVIAALNRKNCHISFVTLRGRKTHDNETKLQCLVRKRIVPLLTAMQLKINHINYDRLIMAETSEEKIETVMKLKADYEQICKHSNILMII